MEKLLLNLQTFDDGASAGTSAGEGTTAENTQGIATPTVKGRKGNNLQNVVYGKQDASDDYSAQTKLPGAEKTVTTKETEERSVQFENMIKGDYKDEFNSRVQKIVQGRIGDTKALQDQNAKMQPIIDMMSRKYGVDASNIDALTKAIQEDDSIFQDEAAKKGMSVEQYKEYRKMESENEHLRLALQQQEARQKGEKTYQDWMQQGEELKEKYGLSNFSFEEELQNPDFCNMLQNGVSVEAAYKAMHFDEMLGGAMAATAKNVSSQVAKNIQARASRPVEGAVNSQPGAIVKANVSQLSKADRAEIARRVAEGETIKW